MRPVLQARICPNVEASYAQPGIVFQVSIAALHIGIFNIVKGYPLSNFDRGCSQTPPSARAALMAGPCPGGGPTGHTGHTGATGRPRSAPTQPLVGGRPPSVRGTNASESQLMALRHFDTRCTGLVVSWYSKSK